MMWPERLDPPPGPRESLIALLIIVVLAIIERLYN